MQLQIVIQLTAEPGKPGGRKPEDRRRESRICIRHESGTGSKDSIQPVAVNIQDVALIDGQLLIEQIGRASCRKECRSRWSPYH